MSPHCFALDLLIKFCDLFSKRSRDKSFINIFDHLANALGRTKKQPSLRGGDMLGF
jgi:hypothetical protein